MSIIFETTNPTADLDVCVLCAAPLNGPVCSDPSCRLSRLTEAPSDRQGDVYISRVEPMLEPIREGRPSSGLTADGFISITEPDALFTRRRGNAHVLVPIGGPVGFRRVEVPGQLVWLVNVPEGSTARLEHRGPDWHHRPIHLEPGTYELAGKVGAVYGICD